MTLEQVSFYANIASFVAVVSIWIILVWILRSRKQSGPVPHASNSKRSWLGFALQFLSFAVLGIGSRFRMPLFSPLFEGQFAVNIILQATAIILIILAVALDLSAFRELGKQWSLQARVLEGHELITTGVYSAVRHPIYTALLAQLIATGIVFSNWISICAAVILFLIGTRIRTVNEERLLKKAFGSEFDAWKKNVPGLIPILRR